MQQTGLFESHIKAWTLTALAFACVATANGQPRDIDTAKSTMTIHVYKAGVLSAFGHDHEISAPVAKGSADVEKRSVELHVDAGALNVHDPTTSEKDIAEIQTTMLGPEVLDAEK